MQVRDPDEVLVGEPGRWLPQPGCHSLTPVRGEAGAGKAGLPWLPRFCGCSTRRVRDPRVVRRLFTFSHPIIAQYGRDAQPVARKDAFASNSLDGAMRFKVTPHCHRVLISPER